MEEEAARLRHEEEERKRKELELQRQKELMRQRQQQQEALRRLQQQQQQQQLAQMKVKPRRPPHTLLASVRRWMPAAAGAVAQCAFFTLNITTVASFVFPLSKLHAQCGA